MKLSEIIKKPVLFLYEAKLEGEITGALIRRSGKKLDYLVHEGEKKSLIKAAKVLSYGKDAIAVMNDFCLISPSDVDRKRYILAGFGELYSSKGEKMGAIEDIEFDEGGVATSLKYSGGSVEFSKIARMNFDIAVCMEEGCPLIRKVAPKKIKMYSTAQQVIIFDKEDKPPVEESEQSVSVTESVAEDYEDSETVYDMREKTSDEHVPHRIISDYGFLLGRKVTANIFSFNRELIVEEGEVITTKIVEKARKYGKLVELTLNSKSVL